MTVYRRRRPASRPARAGRAGPQNDRRAPGPKSVAGRTDFEGPSGTDGPIGRLRRTTWPAVAGHDLRGTDRHDSRLPRIVGPRTRRVVGPGDRFVELRPRGDRPPIAADEPRRPTPTSRSDGRSSATGPGRTGCSSPPSRRPKTAPVVVFNHGWLAVNPGAYGAWIEHLVRSGRIVIFPRYQADDWSRRRPTSCPTPWPPSATRWTSWRPRRRTSGPTASGSR